MLAYVLGLGTWFPMPATMRTAAMACAFERPESLRVRYPHRLEQLLGLLDQPAQRW